MTRIARFHPLICNRNGVVAWYTCDGDADTTHSLPTPYIDAPCASEDEAKELCDVLNAEDAAILSDDNQTEEI